MTGQDLTRSVVEAAPPAAYVAVRLHGIALPDWVALMTLAYIALQSAFLIWRWVKVARRGIVKADDNG